MIPFVGDIARLAFDWFGKKRNTKARRDEVLTAIAAELHELRFLLATVIPLVHSKLKTMNQGALDLIRPILLSYSGDAGDRHAIEATRVLLAKGDATFIAMHNAAVPDPGKALYPVPYAAPVLAGHLGDLGLLPPAMQANVLRVSRELELYNEQVAQVRAAHDRTFDASLTPANYAANDANLKAGTERLAMRAGRLIEAINEVVDAGGRHR